MLSGGYIAFGDVGDIARRGNIGVRGRVDVVGDAVAFFFDAIRELNA